MNDEQLTQRMRAASEAIGLSDTAQARHLNAISEALTAGPSGNVVPLAVTPTSRRRRMVASLVAAAVIAPTGLAAASEGSVPGDALYPVKQLSERVIVLFDSDVIARHRIEEIEALADNADSRLIEDARHALDELGQDHPLWQRLASATAHDEPADLMADEIAEDDDEASENDAVVPVVVGVDLPDGTETLFTIVGQEIRDVKPPSGWSVVAFVDDGATLENDLYLVDVTLLRDGTLTVDVAERTDRAVADDDDSEDREHATTSTTHVSDDDESDDSEHATTSTTAPQEDREDDSESDDREDDDASESP